MAEFDPDCAAAKCRRTVYSSAPTGAGFSFLYLTHGLRRGPHSVAASRLDRRGGCP